MELRFALISDGIRTDILEPIGFDRFEPEIKRNKMHGVSVEYSDVDLEFDDCRAIDIIRSGYESSIDSIIDFVVELKCGSDDFNEIYRGRLDLGTYQFLNKKYKSVKCKVGQIGLLTTFNNRISTDVCVNDNMSLDGSLLTVYPKLNENITLPGKALLLVSEANDAGVNAESEFTVYESPLDNYGQAKNVEFAYVHEMSQSVISDAGNISMGLPRCFTVDKLKYEEAHIDVSDDISEYIEYEYRFRFCFRLKFLHEGGLGKISSIHRLGFSIYADDEFPNGTPKFSTPVGINVGGINSSNAYIDVDIGSSISSFKFKKLYAVLYFTYSGEKIANKYFRIVSVPDAKSYEKLTALSIYPKTQCSVSFVHEVLSRVCESITDMEMGVVSEYYGRDDSDMPFDGAYSKPGRGALRCITNGYKMRNHIYANGDMPRMYISMKKLIQSLSAIDNIGCGFSFEQGRWFLRVEDWKWFYRFDELFKIDSPSNVERIHDIEETYTRLKVGYKKYAEVHEYNTVDTFHSERNYTTLSKVADRELKALSDFIADPYIIEYTRRKALEKDTKDWQYDEDIFVLCIMGVDTKYKDSSGRIVLSRRYDVDTGMEYTGGSVFSPETMLNVAISPARNAKKWVDRLCRYKGSNGLKYSSGTRNTYARGSAKKRVSETWTLDEIEVTTSYVCEDALGYVKENAGVDRVNPSLRAQLLRFEYPITLEQYNKIRLNPYGFISVDGERCWLKSVKYNFKTGLTKFELIPEWI